MIKLSPSVDTLPYRNPAKLDSLCVAGGFFMEEFRDIPGYEGLYQVSNLGRVRSIKRTIPHLSGHRTIEDRILIPSINPYGYYQTGLSKDFKCLKITLHRLIAKAFIPNPYNKPQVNHIDGNKLNNSIDNLEWCTQRENMLHASKMGLMGTPNKGRTGINNHLSKSVVQMNISGDIIAIFDAIMDAERATGIYHSSISAACLGKNKTAGGFKWKHNK